MQQFKNLWNKIGYTIIPPSKAEVDKAIMDDLKHSIDQDLLNNYNSLTPPHTSVHIRDFNDEATKILKQSVQSLANSKHYKIDGQEIKYSLFSGDGTPNVIIEPLSGDSTAVHGTGVFERKDGTRFIEINFKESDVDAQKKADVMIKHTLEHLHVHNHEHHTNHNKDVSDMLSYYNYFNHEDKGECYLGSIINDPKSSCGKDYKPGTHPFAPVDDYKLIFNNLKELNESAQQTTSYENTTRNVATGGTIIAGSYLASKLCCRKKNRHTQNKVQSEEEGKKIR